MPAPNSPLALNPSLDEAYFVSKGFAPDVARAMATGVSETTPADNGGSSPKPAAPSPGPAAAQGE